MISVKRIHKLLIYLAIFTLALFCSIYGNPARIGIGSVSAQSDILVYEDSRCDTQDMLDKANVSEDSEAGQEIVSLYRTLLGITDELNAYAQKFRDNNSDYINLFPLAYYHVTEQELAALRNGNYRYPREKMEQMILFYDAYKVNRDGWDSGRKDQVEEHWKNHFEIAEQETDGSIEGLINWALDDKAVLSTAIDAHINYDLPRALYEALKNIDEERLNSILGELFKDFRGTQDTLKTAFENVQEELNYNLFNESVDSLFNLSDEQFDDVINWRNEAWEEASKCIQIGECNFISSPQPVISDHSAYEENATEKYCQIIEPTERDGDRKRGQNFGDPHLFTFDGYRYSFQLAGEFILSKSDDGLFEAQVRQVPISSSLSVDSAVAMKMGRDRVALYADDFPDEDTSTPVRVNGNSVTVEEELDLQGGGKIYHRGNDYVFEWPTGEELVAQLSRDGENPFLNITVYVFESQADHLVGLLGNSNGDADDDLRFRSGSVLPTRDTYGNIESLVERVSPVRLPLDSALNLYLESLAKDYGSDWRISQSESLFDYAPGQSTATFTLENFPAEYLALEQLSSTELRQARTTCLDMSVEPELMEGCVFDVAFSGRSEFARATARISQAVELLQDLGIDVPNLEREILDRIPDLPGGIRIPGLPF